MPLRVPLRRQLGYAFYDWTREMPAAKRATVWAGLLLQGYAIYAGLKPYADGAPKTTNP